MAFGDNMKEVEDPSLKTSENFENYESSIHEERIKNAPKIVQDYYAGKACKFEKGLFRVLVAKKSNRCIFIVMIMLAAIVFIKANLGNSENLAVVAGYECELQSFSYDETIFASIKIHPVAKTRNQLKKEKASDEIPLEKFEKDVKITLCGYTDSGARVPFEEEINGKIYDNEQIFRTRTIDYDIINVSAVVSVGSETDEISVKVTKKLQ